MYLNPECMTSSDEQRICRWLDANGCRDYIAIAPIVVRGNIATYQAICRRRKNGRRWDGKPGGIHLDADRDVLTTTRRLRIRIPLRKVA